MRCDAGRAPDDLGVGVRQQFLFFGGHPVPVADMAAEEDRELMLRAVGVVEPDEGNLLAFDIRPLRHVQQVEFLELAPHRDADEVGVEVGVALLSPGPASCHRRTPALNLERQPIKHLPANERLPRALVLPR